MKYLWKIGINIYNFTIDSLVDSRAYMEANIPDSIDFEELKRAIFDSGYRVRYIECNAENSYPLTGGESATEIKIKPLQNFDFVKLARILKQYSFQIAYVINGIITIASPLNMTELNLYWYC